MEVSNDSTLGESEVAPHAPPSGIDADAMKASIAGNLFGDVAMPLRIGRYEVREMLGAGGMGVVYAAWDPGLGRKIALKLLPQRASSSEARRTRMLREAQALAKLSHPNVVHVYEVGEQGSDVFLAMELVEGPSLREWLESTPRSTAEIERVFAQAGAGLVAAHRADLVHRDFKPSNVIVGDDGRVRVLDFGLAHGTGSGVGSTDGDSGSSEDARLTDTGAVVGTPAYMAPEQFRGEHPDARVDQFAFCVALFEAFAGARPYTHETLRDAPATAVIESWGRIPRSWRGPLRRGLETSPSSRWPSLEALLDAQRKGRRRRTAARWLGVAALVGVTIPLAARTPEPCTDLAKSPPGWTETDAAAIANAFSATNAPFADDVWLNARSNLDSFAEAWSESRSAACKNPGNPEMIRCLRRAETALEAVVDQYESVDATSVADIHPLATLLESPRACAQDPRTAFGGELGEDSLGVVARAAAELATNRAEDARRRLDLLIERESPRDTDLLAEAYRLRARANALVGNEDAALDDVARSIREASGGDTRARSLATWARLLLQAERVASALDALRLLEAHLTDHEAASGLRADLLELRGRATTGDAAVQNLRQALALREEAGDEAKRRTTRMALANALSEGTEPAELKESETLFKEELAQRRAELGDDHPMTAVALFNLGVFLADTHQQWERGEALLKEAEAIESRTLDIDAPGRARTRLKLGELAVRLGRLEEAQALVDSAWSRLRSLPSTHSDHVAARTLLADVASAREDYPGSLEHHRALAELNPRDVFVRQNIAYASTQLDDAESARKALKTARALVEVEPLPPEIAALLQLYFRSIDAEIARIEGRSADALAILDEVEADAASYDTGDDPTLTAQLALLQPELDAIRSKVAEASR